MNIVPKDVITELKVIQKKFVWRGRKPKIKHSTLNGDYWDRGLKNIDMEMKFKALKIFWIRRLVDDSSNPWKAIANSWWKDNGGTLVFHSNFCLSSDCKESVKNLPKFYQQLIEFLEPVSAGSSNEVEFILTQNLWNNSCINNDSGPLFNHLFSTLGINYVLNLLDFHIGCKNYGKRFKMNLIYRLKRHGLIMALPPEWRNTITRAAPENTTNDLNVKIVLDAKTVLLRNLKTKTVYRIFVKGLLKSLTAQKSISRKLTLK